MVNCRYCDEEISNDAFFCPKCGMRTKKGETDKVPIPGDSLTKLRQDLDEALIVASDALSEAFTIAADSIREAFKGVSEGIESKGALKKESSGKKVYCPHCGKENPKDAKYCKNCGKNIK
jgi:predicted amidophosphoribosyltransferase